MKFGHYRLIAQLGVGTDGIAYLAQDERDASTVELRHLIRAVAEPARRAQIDRRLRSLDLVEHPGLLQIRERLLDDESAFVVVERVERGLLDFAGDDPADRETVLAWASLLAGALAQVHRVGVAVGPIGLGAVRMRNARSPCIDATGLRTSGAAAPGADPQSMDVDEEDPASHYMPDDVRDLGSILRRLLRGSAGDATLHSAPVQTTRSSTEDPALGLIDQMLREDPEERPSAAAIAARLEALLERDRTAPSDATAAESPEARSRQGRDSLHAGDRLGRFELVGLLAQGGMGRVFRARDLSDDSAVALKVLTAVDDEASGTALRRLRKEARMLAQVDNPHIARFIEVNRDRGIDFLAMELVEGQTLRQLLREKKVLGEREALRILCDVARALADAHDLGIVHRDVKPSNILLVAEDGRDAAAKLCDFGLARPIEQHDSADVTRAGTILGTPHYMSPEQCGGRPVDVRSDVYTMGVTLFEMLAGQTPFVGDNAVALATSHMRDAPPSLKALRPDASDPIVSLVDRALRKNPDERPVNARAMLDEMESILRGEASSIDHHPVVPVTGRPRVSRFLWTWQLGAPPEALWPYVTNTDRLNRAIGLGPVDFESRFEGDDVTVEGRSQVAGRSLCWREHPFEWIEARRMGVLREFSSGPVRWLRSTTELHPRLGGGTVLTHGIDVETSGVGGRAAAALQIGVKTRRALDRVYRRIDEVLGALRARSDGGSALLDPFERPAELTADRQRRLDNVEKRLVARGVSPEVAGYLCAYIERAAPQALARIRPLALARSARLPVAEVVRACLLGAQEGILTLRWDLLCPACRVAGRSLESLRALRAQAQCASCGTSFGVDFASHVEMLFEAHPQIREPERRTYCIGGPAHLPHVAVQLRLRAGERFVIDVALAEGRYRFGGRGIPQAFVVRVHPAAIARAWDLSLREGLPAAASRSLLPGRQRIAMTNDLGREVLVRIERVADREDALTAARAACLPLFQEIFPGEVLSPDETVGLSTVTLLLTSLGGVDRLPERRACALLLEHHRRVERDVALEGGAVVKLWGDGVLAAFTEPVAAVRAGLRLPEPIGDPEEGVQVRAAVHAGPALVVGIDDRIEYVGTTVRVVTALAEAAGFGEVALSEAVQLDPGVEELLRGAALAPGRVLAPSFGPAALGLRPSLAPPAERPTAPTVERTAHG